MRHRCVLPIVVLTVFLIFACAEETQTMPEQKSQSAPRTVLPAKITFVELGSVNCIPCRKMQPVMKSIEEKYRDQVQVIFYDVWKPDQKHYAREYGIRLIPTQVFLDQEGKEILRHEGYFPEEEIDRLLQTNGLKILAAKDEK
jgi:thioredoxin 1